MDNKHHLRERIHDFVMMPRHLKWILAIAIFVAAIGSLGLFALSYPSSWSVGFKAADGKMLADSAIDFHFDRPMSRDVTITISPAIDGNWTFEDRLSRLHLSRDFHFEPVQTWMPGTTYTITFHKLRNVFAFSGEDMSYTFSTQSSPHVASVTPTSEAPVAPNTPITLSLTSKNTGIAKFSLVSDPVAIFTEATALDQQSLTFTPTALLEQGVTYHMKIVRNDLRYFRDSKQISYEGPDEIEKSFDILTSDPPGITDLQPQGNNVKSNAAIQITFSSPPLKSALSNILVDPPVKGDWSTSGNIATFTPAAVLAPETAYTVSLPKGLAMENAGYLPEKVSYSFTIIGHVKVASFSPQNNASGVAVDRQIKITFDQEVDHTSALQHLNISPSIFFDAVWDKTTLIITPKNPLSLDATYTFALTSGIQSISGLPSDHAYTSSFSTEPSVVKLSVVYDHQDRALSCEVAALKMALAEKGVHVTESTLIALVGFDSTPHKGNVWGDPYKAFVGNIDGRQISTGYGVYWSPIAAAASKYRPAEAFTNGTIQKLTDEISKGNPIVVWGSAGSGRRVDWVTPTGKKIIAVMGEHARVVKGFYGSKDNPTKIIVTDPLHGDIIYSTASFDANWALLGRSGVIVR